MSPTHAGRVLVVPSEELDRLGRFQGFHPDASRYLEALLSPDRAEFRPRAQVEDDPSFKQIIPYVVLRSGNLVFCYTRGSGQAEVRLHRRRSLGVGGHVDEADADGRATREAYEIALHREIEEEIILSSPGTIRLAGLINDDSTEVGRVHLGVVHVYSLLRPEVAPRESGLAEAGFLTQSEVVKDRARFETWSQLCIDSLRPPADS